VPRHHYYVYILANRARTIYTGVTNDLGRRLLEHKQRAVPGFAAKYGLDRLVYFEESDDVHAALMREKQIKAWTRARRVALIVSLNPEWDDLSSLLLGDADPKPPITPAREEHTAAI
jgi:putative endonuclease